MQAIANLVRPIIRLLECLAPVADLGIRLWVATVFWKSGLAKIASPDLTVMLFENEYSVPLLSPQTAAFLGTWAELILPIMLALGLGGRFAAVGLFVFNIVAVISYPTLNVPGQLQHLMWGLMLLLPVCRGPGLISIDHLFRRKYLDPL